MVYGKSYHRNMEIELPELVCSWRFLTEMKALSLKHTSLLQGMAADLGLINWQRCEATSYFDC